MANTWFEKKQQRKITCSTGGNETESDFILVGKNNTKYLKDVKAIPWKLQHRMVVTDMNKRKLRKVVKNEQIFRRVWKLKENNMKTKFQERARELADVDALNLWNTFKNSMLQACDEVCGKKNRSEENKAKYKNIKNRTKKVVADSIRKEAEKELTKSNKTPNIFTLVKFMKKNGKDIEGGRCTTGKDGRLGFSEKDRKRIWKDHVEEIMNNENNWDHVTEASIVKKPIKDVIREEMTIAIKVMKPAKVAGPSEVCAEMIFASGEVGVGVMVDLCQRVLDGKGMPDEWQTSMLVPIFKGKGDVRNCNTYRGVKLLEHAMKIVESVFWREEFEN